MQNCNSKKLPDVRWHIGYVTKDEDDPRRHQNRCIHYNKDDKSCAYASYCKGSSQCGEYEERTVENVRKRNRAKTAKTVTSNKPNNTNLAQHQPPRNQLENIEYKGQIYLPNDIIRHTKFGTGRLKYIYITKKGKTYSRICYGSITRDMPWEEIRDHISFLQHDTLPTFQGIDKPNSGKK